MAAHGRYQVAGEYLEAASAARLGAVHGGVDAAQQDLRIDGLILQGADPDADGYGYLELAYINRLGQGGDNLGGNLFGLFGMIQVVQQNNELIASDRKSVV